MGWASLLPIFIATVISFAFGAIWYGPLFGKKWMKLIGFTKKSMKAMKLKPATAMVLGFISTFVMVYILSIFVTTYNFCGEGWTNIKISLVMGLLIWFGLIATLSLGSFLWEGKSFKLYIFNNIYYLINIELIVVILNLCTFYF